MKKKILIIFLLLPLLSFSQFKEIINLPHTKIKNQQKAGICWDYATLSFLESEIYRMNNFWVDLSEQFFVYHTFMDKAQMYIWLYGDTRFGSGGLAHDVLYEIKKYGIVPEKAYKTTYFNDDPAIDELKNILDKYATKDFVPSEWKKEYENKLVEILGSKPPQKFNYKGKSYTPRNFAFNYLKLDPNNYMEFTSFIHNNYYEQFVLQIPDNWLRGQMWNLPINLLTQLAIHSLEEGYTVLWDGDVSEEGFNPLEGVAELTKEQKKEIRKLHYNYNKYREITFNNHTTSDDHLMHIVGLAEKNGKKYFIVKNSWGKIGKYSGYIYMSIDYFKAKTIFIMVHKDVLTETIKERLWGEEEEYEKD